MQSSGPPKVWKKLHLGGFSWFYIWSWLFQPQHIQYKSNTCDYNPQASFIIYYTAECWHLTNLFNRKVETHASVSTSKMEFHLKAWEYDMLISESVRAEPVLLNCQNLILRLLKPPLQESRFNHFWWAQSFWRE